MLIDLEAVWYELVIEKCICHEELKGTKCEENIDISLRETQSFSNQ